MKLLVPFRACHVIAVVVVAPAAIAAIVILAAVTCSGDSSGDNNWLVGENSSYIAF